MFDPSSAFRGIAQRVNALKVDPNAKCFFECMSGGLIWADEQPPFDLNVSELGALRVLWNYRTSLLLENPRTEFYDVWKSALLLAPQWPGFLPERRQPRPDLLALIPKTKKTEM
jgi:hypothetical protein